MAMGMEIGFGIGWYCNWNDWRRPMMIDCCLCVLLLLLLLLRWLRWWQNEWKIGAEGTHTHTGKMENTKTKQNDAPGIVCTFSMNVTQQPNW